MGLRSPLPACHGIRLDGVAVCSAACFNARLVFTGFFRLKETVFSVWACWGTLKVYPSLLRLSSNVILPAKIDYTICSGGELLTRRVND